MGKYGACSVLGVELWAIKTGLCIAWERRIPKIIIESDCLQAIDLINVDHPLRKMIWDCKVLLHNPRECHISHVDRQASKCGDALVKEAHDLSLDVCFD